MKEVVIINEALCQGCGSCVDMCPQQILYIDPKTNTARVTDHARCDRRRGCEKVCPVRAIKIL